VQRQPDISIVVIDSDVDSLNGIVRSLKGIDGHANVVGTATVFENGFELIHKKRPNVVIMDVCREDLEPSLERMKTVLVRFPQTSIFAMCEDRSADTILQVMRAGATEYLLKPVADVDLTSALQKVGRLWTAKPAADSDNGRIFMVFGPKGGVGVTTIAVNLAVNIFDITGKPTVLVDLDLNAGDVTTFLNMNPHYTMHDVAENINRLDKNFLQNIITRHESGIYVLAEPHKVEEAFSISGDAVKKVLGILKSMFSYIVLDTEPAFNERTVAGIDMAESLVLAFAMSLPGIKNMQRCLDFLEQKGVSPEKMKLVVTRYLLKGDIKLENAEKILNHRIFLGIPNDYQTAMASLNKGVPLNSFDARSRLNLAMRELAHGITTRKRGGV
jgi:pilus assembly protein CpaE